MGGHFQSGAAGRAVFAAGGQVLHEVDLPGPPQREVARWSLLPLLVQRPKYVPYLVARLGRVSATITRMAPMTTIRMVTPPASQLRKSARSLPSVPPRAPGTCLRDSSRSAGAPGVWR